MRDKIMQMVQENPRTVKDLADALGVTKQEILTHLSALPVEAVRTVSYGGRSRPVVIMHWVSKP
jgi:predicted ArsR family transcriptional regulator